MPNKLSIIWVQLHNNNCQKIRLFGCTNYQDQDKIGFKSVLKFKQEAIMKKSIKQEEDEDFDPIKHQARKRLEFWP